MEEALDLSLDRILNEMNNTVRHELNLNVVAINFSFESAVE